MVRSSEGTGEALANYEYDMCTAFVWIVKSRFEKINRGVSTAHSAAR